MFGRELIVVIWEIRKQKNSRAIVIISQAKRRLKVKIEEKYA